MNYLPPRTGILGAFAATALSSLALSSAASAQGTSVVFPMAPNTAVQAAVHGLGERSLATDLSMVAGLQRHDAITMTGFPMPNGTDVTLELKRVNVERRKFGIHVDGVVAPDAMHGLGLTVWEGNVAGDPQSEVMLGFSNYGSRGWIRSQTSLVHLMAKSHRDGSWLGAPGIVTTERVLNAAGIHHDSTCSTAPPQVAPTPSAFQPTVAGLVADGMESISLRECPIAMETDWQYYEVFGDLNAATAYATTLLSFISNRYELQASTILTFPYLQFYTTPNDPWSTPDNGGSAGDMLNELVTAWQGNIPMNAQLAHMMSGAGLGGGVAFLDVLCNPDFNFAVSGNIGGNVSFPVVQQPSNWDFIVVAHEIGHNFNAPHTHDFCPPLDECPPSQYFGACQTQQTCSNSGSIMSYCHLCSGGTGNITTYFHPDNADRMRAASAACNQALFEVAVDVPEELPVAMYSAVTLQEVTGTLDAATMYFRVGNTGGFTVRPMHEQTGGKWVGILPLLQCGANVHVYFEFDVTGQGSFTAPINAPTDTYRGVASTPQLTFGDDFESDKGWVATNNGASTGDWERGVPVNDSGWQYDPVSDADGSGSCFLTGNQVGNSDVDGGSVSLTSPAFYLTLFSYDVGYSYFLNLTNSDGVDHLLVEARNVGGAFVEVARHDMSNGLAWTDVALTPTVFLNAGLNRSLQLQLRFTVNDSGDPSIVEAGIDAFFTNHLNCLGPGYSFCPPTTNSTGLSAHVGASGSGRAADNDITLSAGSLPPNVLGYFLTSKTQGFVAFPGGSLGNLCLGGDIGRYVGSVLSSGPQGVLSMQLDLTQTPQPLGAVDIVAGETWSFQLWFRDSVSGTAVSNFTNAVAVPFR